MHRNTMSRNTLGTVRRDLTMITSLCLLGLVVLAVLTGLGMDDEVEGLLPLDDIHPLMSYVMAVVAGLHAVLQLGSMRRYIRKRFAGLADEPAQRGSDASQAQGVADKAG
jgi:hypothetical protein